MTLYDLTTEQMVINRMLEENGGELSRVGTGFNDYRGEPLGKNRRLLQGHRHLQGRG